VEISTSAAKAEKRTSRFIQNLNFMKSLSDFKENRIEKNELKLIRGGWPAGIEPCVLNDFIYNVCFQNGDTECMSASMAFYTANCQGAQQ